MNCTFFLTILCIALSQIHGEKIGKKVTDFNDVDVEKLLDQWNENDDDYDDEDDDFVDPRKKPPPKVDMQKVFKAGGNKEDIIKASKKGQPMMMFVTVSGNPTREETETTSMLWQTSLQNNNIQVQRYVIADDRVLFQLKDGSLAFEIRDFLVTQDTCLTVTFEQLEFKCKPKKTEL
uniref:Lipoprotein receptor-related protein chaperone MESD protein n=1 Tax=Clytia hemisphaerica TaxID=252671 RepID=A0A069DMS1_9CNID